MLQKKTAMLIFLRKAYSYIFFKSGYLAIPAIFLYIATLR